MTIRFGQLWPALILLGGIGYPYLIHSAIVGGQSESIRVALALLPMLALAGWVVTRARNKLPWSCVVLAAGMLIYVSEHEQRWGLAATYGLSHALIYLFLLWFFGQTLRRGKEPLVTRLARSIHGALPSEMATYTRRVTIAWCLFFTAQMIISALLLKIASLDTWSLFVNILNFPLLALMFISEYVYRITRHREFPPASFFDGIRAFSNDATRATDTKVRLPGA